MIRSKTPNVIAPENNDKKKVRLLSNNNAGLGYSKRKQNYINQQKLKEYYSFYDPNTSSSREDLFNENPNTKKYPKYLVIFSLIIILYCSW